MRLEDGDQAARTLFAQGREGGPDLGRVVGVVVIYTDAGAAALELEAALYAREIGEGSSDIRGLEPGGRGGKRQQRER